MIVLIKILSYTVNREIMPMMKRPMTQLETGTTIQRVARNLTKKRGHCDLLKAKVTTFTTNTCTELQIQ